MAASGHLLCLCRSHFWCERLLLGFVLYMEAKRLIFCVLCLWMMERCYSLWKSSFELYLENMLAISRMYNSPFWVEVRSGSVEMGLPGIAGGCPCVLGRSASHQDGVGSSSSAGWAGGLTPAFDMKSSGRSISPSCGGVQVLASCLLARRCNQDTDLDCRG